ncbi:MAG: hypothetical protein KDK50_03475 [Chlamydiia bacterium]|nr:hypothetical protein [Chlamydiia bacterium]
MKKLLALLIVSCSLALHGAGCTSCAQRRAQAMANRPPVAKIFPKHLKEISEYDDLMAQFENGDYATFLEKQHNAALKVINNPSHKNPFVRRNANKTSRFYFGVPALTFFMDFPSPLLELKLERAKKLLALIEEDNESYLDPMLKCLGTFSLSDEQTAALQTLSKLRGLSEEDASELESALIKIDQEFFVTQQVFNSNFVRGKSVDPVKARKYTTVLELEMARQMHQACVDAQDEELANQFKVVQSMIIPLTKVLGWEKFLQLLASGSYKFPGKVGQDAIKIQKEYNEQKSQMMRDYMELALY